MRISKDKKENTRLSLWHRLCIVLLKFDYRQVALDVDDVDWLRLKFQYHACSNAGAGDACFPNAKLVECTISIFGTTFMQSVVKFPLQWDASEVEDLVMERTIIYLERSKNKSASCFEVWKVRNSSSWSPSWRLSGWSYICGFSEGKELIRLIPSWGAATR